MFKNPVTNLVLGIVVVLWALYSLFGPHEEAQSQGVIILQVVLLICAAAGVVGSAILIAKRNQEREAADVPDNPRWKRRPLDLVRGNSRRGLGRWNT